MLLAVAAVDEGARKRQRTSPPPVNIGVTHPRAANTVFQPTQTQLIPVREPGPRSTSQPPTRLVQAPGTSSSTQITLGEAVPRPGLPRIPPRDDTRSPDGLQLALAPEAGQEQDAPPAPPAPRRNMQEEARNSADALHRAINDRSTTIGTSTRASKGIQPWSRGTGPNGAPCADVKVMFAQLDEPKLRKLDGNTSVTTKAGDTVSYKPIRFGTTVLEFGKGAGKTWRTVEFVQTHVQTEDVPITLVVTARRNLAGLMSTGFKKAGILCNNYMDAPKPTTEEVTADSTEEEQDEEEVQEARRAAAREELAQWGPQPSDPKIPSVVEHLQLPVGEKGVIIISLEQVHKLEEYQGGLGAFQNCTLFIDEPVTAASSFGGTTVRWPLQSMNVLKQIASSSKYTILTDADVSIDGKLEAFVRGIAPLRDVLHIQSTRPAMERTNFFGFSGIAKHKKIFDDRFELSLLRSHKARQKGTPNRTFFGGNTPSQVIKAADKAQKLGVANLAYHGKMDEAIRERHFKDADTHMEPADLVAASTIMGVGTDIGLKFSHGFFMTSKGSETFGIAVLRLINQLLGRTHRNESCPLDGLTVEGVHYPGVTFTLIAGDPPSFADPEARPAGGPARGDRVDRVDRKFREAAADKQKYLRMCAETDAAIEQEYDKRNGISVQTERGLERLPIHNSAPITISDALEEIIAWNEVERRDNYEDHTTKLIELWKLPTSGYKLRPLPPLTEAENEELDALRKEAGNNPRLEKDEDREISEMSPKKQYEYVKDSVANDDTTRAAFWKNCCGLKPKPKTTKDGRVIQLPQPVANGKDIAFKEVHEALRYLEYFPESADDYIDLFNDRKHMNIRSRGLMRYVPESDIQDAQYMTQKTGYMGATEIQESLPAATKMVTLKKFATSMGLELCDLLEPREFKESTHRFVEVHNQIQRGKATAEDRAFAHKAREDAKAIGLKTKIVVNGQKPTGLHKVFQAVLKEECAMRPTADEVKLGGDSDRAKSTLNSLKVEEMAPGCAENMRVWHPRLHRMVRASDYKAAEQQCINIEAEAREQRRIELVRAEYYAEMGDAEPLDLGRGVAPISTPAPYDKNVMHEPFDAAKVEECLRDWGADELQRKAAREELLRLSAAESSGTRQDEMRDLQRALNKLEVRHAIVARLAAELTPKDAEGRQFLKVEYEYKAGGFDAGRRYAKVPHMDYGDREPRPLSLQGLPRDLRPKLSGRFLHDVIKDLRVLRFG